jgi:hypothetical protein
VKPTKLTRISALAKRAGVSPRTMLRQLKRMHADARLAPEDDWLVQYVGPKGRKRLLVNEELLRRASPGLFAPPKRIDASTLETLIEDLAHRVRRLERVTEHHSRTLGAPRG